ncbi:hypothetical protein VARIO8X_110172 [Burkholderiales bacterium 8X]|nr:hypothetical protein VARIO8X_110172 [Burkholderiales bacterium 8X]
MAIHTIAVQLDTIPPRTLLMAPEDFGELLRTMLLIDLYCLAAFEPTLAPKFGIQVICKAGIDFLWFNIDDPEQVRLPRFSETVKKYHWNFVVFTKAKHPHFVSCKQPVLAIYDLNGLQTRLRNLKVAFGRACRDA